MTEPGMRWGCETTIGLSGCTGDDIRKKGGVERPAYDKRFGEFFAGDKGMHTCLLRSPSGNGIQC